MQIDLADIVGKDWVVEDVTEYAVSGVWPKAVVWPGTEQELAEVLRRANESRWIVVPAGFGTGLSLGNQIPHIDLVISTRRLNKILDYEPADLTASVQGGCSLETFNQACAEYGQWLPLDPPVPSSASLGAVAAVQDFGPLRLGFGLPRDYVIGLEVALPEGVRIKSGGHVVKNVAGFDLNKLFVGSFGTLGIITQLNVKLRPRPETEVTCVVLGSNETSLYRFSQRIAKSEVSPVAMLLISSEVGQSIRLSCDMGSALVIRLMGVKPAIRYEVNQLKELALDYNNNHQNSLRIELSEIMQEAGETLWRSIRDFPANPQLNVAIKANVAPTSCSFAADQLNEALQPLATNLYRLSEPQNGVVRVMGYMEPTETRCEQLVHILSNMRTVFQSENAAVIIERAPLEVKQRIDIWGEVVSGIEIMRALKHQFDPRRILNPQRFVMGI